MLKPGTYSVFDLCWEGQGVDYVKRASAFVGTNLEGKVKYKNRLFFITRSCIVLASDFRETWDIEHNFNSKFEVQYASYVQEVIWRDSDGSE